MLAVEPGLGDIASEPWFLALAGSMLAVMGVLFAVTLFVRRTQLGKKSHLGVAVNGECYSVVLGTMVGRCFPERYSVIFMRKLLFVVLSYGQK